MSQTEIPGLGEPVRAKKPSRARRVSSPPYFEPGVDGAYQVALSHALTLQGYRCAICSGVPTPEMVLVDEKAICARCQPTLPMEAS